MSVANSKKTASSQADIAWAASVARIRRGGGSSRLGRRSALLGVLTSMYANSSRGSATVSGARTSSETRTASTGNDRA